LTMELRLKQRLVGAAVLATVAVLVLPILLDGPPEPEQRVVVTQVPVKPQQEFRSRIRPLDQEPPAPVAAARGAETEGRVSRSAPAPLALAAPPAANAEPPVAKPKPQPKPAPEPKPQPAPKPKPKPAAEKQPAPKAPPAARQVSGGWVIQMASFSSHENATKLRNQLRAKGHAAHVEHYDSPKGKRYRVRVGPELEKGRAETLRDRLHKEFKLRGLLVRYP